MPSHGQPMTARQGTPWWREKPGQAHDALWKLIEQLRNYEMRRRSEDMFHMALYGDKGAKDGVAGGRLSRLMDERNDRLGFNLVKSVTDAAQATIAAQSIRPRILTQGGDWGLRKRAQQMQLCVEGEFDRNNVMLQAHDGFLDAGKVGTTGFKIYSRGGRPVVELVRPGELMVDPVDGQYRNPRRMYQVALIDKQVVAGLYGRTDDLKSKIYGAPTKTSYNMFPWLPTDTALEQILVVEAWSPPDPEDWSGNQDGRHIISINGATLVDEEWDRGFPFALWRYDHESTGFWGRGIAANLRQAQRELNYVLRKIQACIHRSAGYRIMVQGNSRVNSDEITNEPGTLLRYFGVIPQVLPESTVPVEFFRHAEDIIRRGFEQEGVSMLGAMSQKPAGLNSGAALREYNDTESERFLTKSKSFERFVGVDVAKRIIEEKRWIAEHAPEDEQPVRAETRRGRRVMIQMVKWGDARMDPEQYAVRVFPSSALPSTPAGRLATVESWINTGLIGREEALQLLDFPDLEDYTTLQLAPYEIVLDAIETMVEDGTYVPPEPLQDLQLTLKLATNSYLRYRVDGIPEDRGELLLRYIADVQALIDEAEQAAIAKKAAQPTPQPGDPALAAVPPMVA